MRILFAAVVGLADISVAVNPLPELNMGFERASARVEDNVLKVGTSAMERSWRWTGHGFATVGVKDLRNGQEWVDAEPAASADWAFPELFGANAPARLVRLTARESDDDGFTTRHLEVTAEIEYPEDEIYVRFVIWAYPDAPGLRTQLWVKGHRAGGAANGGASSIQTLHGKPYTNPKARSELPAWIASTLTRSDELVFRLEGLQADRSYTFGLSWLDYGGGGRRQSVELATVDGETKVLAVKPTVLPAWKGKREPPARIQVEVPGALALDGTTTVRIASDRGPNVCVSELWLYEDSAAPPGKLSGDPRRIRELSESAPDGTRLVAYLDAGGKGQTVEAIAENRVDFLPVSASQARGVGYFNDTQHRHTTKTHLVREEIVPAGQVDWANLVSVESEQGGVVVVKESHKCANQPGVQTGGFGVGNDGVSVTGSGLAPEDLRADDYRWCWATWTLLYSEPTADARELVLKQFDRLRYPVNLDLDVYVKANTWGSGGSHGIDSKQMSEESEVLAEIDSVAELGLDTLQIDDGWQVGRMPGKHFADQEWYPRSDWYPDGWSNVVRRASARNIRLGIWLAARAPLEALKWNYEQAHFATWKLDFANLSTFDGVEGYLAKGRAFVAYTGHKVRVNWDVTENAPRFGYFWARECGSIWLANRKPASPANTIPKPWLQLRETWELARYLNSNRFELPIQNFQRIDPESSDAPLHSTGYSVALGLSGIPVFFQTTRLLSPEQRTEIKRVLAPYKEHRRAMFESFVFPIGDEPDNASWSGFQWCHPDSKTGYLLVFRELHSKEASRSVSLRFVANQQVMLTDLLRGSDRHGQVGDDGALPLVLPEAPGFRFLKYRAM